MISVSICILNPEMEKSLVATPIFAKDRKIQWPVAPEPLLRLTSNFKVLCHHYHKYNILL